MPEYKRQHYVPRCHLKPFSLDQEGTAINLYNLNAERSIKNAPLKSQCARNYFYGKDLEIEKTLRYLEDDYSEVLRKIQNDQYFISKVNLDILRFFCKCPIPSDSRSSAPSPNYTSRNA